MFIIGGAAIYSLFIDYVDSMYITEIDKEYDSDDQIIDIIDEPVNPSIPPIPQDPMHAYFNQTNNVN